jgi:hypothetical protein
MKRAGFVLLASALLILLGSCDRDELKKGVKIYEYSGDFQKLADKWKEIGINTAFLSRELASERSFRQMLEKNDVEVFLIFPVFYNPDALRKDSTLYAITQSVKKAKDDWVEFVCPSAKSYRKSKIDEAAELVKSLDPDVLSIDFIRQFVFWEMIYPDSSPESIETACFCDSCTAGFCSEKNVILPDSLNTPQMKASFILQNHSNAWNDYRCLLITSMVEEIAEAARREKPGIKINLHVVPWRDRDFGGANIRVAAQDISKLALYADYISPMCYSQMVRRGPEWISSVVEEMDKKAPGKILPSIQVNPYYIEDRFTPEDFSRCNSAALKKPSAGVVYFSWPLFEKDSARIEIARRR